MTLLIAPLAALFAASTGTTVPSQNQEPLWRLTTDHAIRHHRVTTPGTPVVSTGGALIGVSPADGSIAWQRSDLPSPAEVAAAQTPSGGFGTGQMGGAVSGETGLDLHLLWGTPYALVAVRSSGQPARFEMIDVGTGERRWDSDPLPIEDLRGHFQLPGNERLLLYGPDRETRQPTLAAVTLETGELLWRNDGLFEKAPAESGPMGSGSAGSGAATILGHQPPLFDSDTTAILFLSKEGLLRLDLRTGQPLWRATTKADPPALVKGFAPMLLVDGVVYLPADRRVHAFRVEDGAPLWPKPPKLDGIVAQMQVTEAGLVVAGTPERTDRGGWAGGKFFVGVLDPATGSVRWKQKGGGPPFVYESGTLYVADGKGVSAVNASDGEVRQHARLKFQGGEEPVRLERRGPNLLLASTQNLALVDSAGRVLYHTYFEAPPAALFGKIAGVVLMVASVYSAATYGGLVPTSVPFWSRDRTTLFTSDYAYIVTEHAPGPDGPRALVKISKDTGDVERWVAVHDKSPEYEVDAAGQLLFLKTTDREILCYRF